SFPGSGGAPSSTPNVSYPASDFAPGTNDFSVQFGIQTTAAHQAVLGNRADASNGNFFAVRMTSSGIVTVELDQDGFGTNYVAVASSAPLNDGAYHFVSITRSGTTLSLYVDGALNA